MDKNTFNIENIIFLKPDVVILKNKMRGSELYLLFITNTNNITNFKF